MIVSVVLRLMTELARAMHLSSLRMLRSLDRSMTELAVRRELNTLPDFLLKDLGVARSNIGYVARVLAARRLRTRRTADFIRHEDRANADNGRRCPELKRPRSFPTNRE
ncbi:MAG: hypothetical protein ABWZ64_10780 [Xanthobacteraceae bacterium]